MKSLLFSFVLIVPLTGFSQTEKDCKEVMGKFVSYYNKGQVDSINSLFFEPTWNEDQLESCKKDMGDIISYKFMVIDSTDLDVGGNPMAYFAVVTTEKVWKRKTNAMAIALNEEKKIYGRRILTKSPNSDKMLKKYSR